MLLQRFSRHQQVHSVKKWKHYLIGKETIIHTDHQPLQYLQSQTKLQKSHHFRWMGFLQQFHLVIKYKKGTGNKLADMLSRPPIFASIILHNASLSFEIYVEQYANDDEFKEIYEKLTHGSQVDNYHLQGKLLYHLGKLCIPTGERVHVIREVHTSLVFGHFSIEKTLCHVQRFFFWPHRKNIVNRYVKGCVMCYVSNPSNRKLRLYTPLPILSHPWESVSMDFLGGLPLSRKSHDYLYVIIDYFNKMCILVSCKKQIIVEKTAHLFFQHVWVHFGLPTSIVSDQNSLFLREFWTSLWKMMDTKLKRSMEFHPQTDGQIEVVNHT